MSEPHLMQCMEVWGGNQPCDQGVVMAGLDCWLYCKPYEDAAAGGDVYYVSSCATGRITRLLVADVSGHGRQVAELGEGLRQLMRRYVNHLDQCTFVRAMNTQFGALARAGTFATAVVTTFFSPTGHLSICNAGHPPPLRYDSAAGRWSVLREDGDAAGSPVPAQDNVPLGILDLADYQQFDVRLRVGDLVLCYTDSLIEARGADGQMLGVAGLLSLLGSLPSDDALAFTPALLSALRRLHARNLSGDDVTVMLFRPNGTSAGVRLGTRLLAPLKVARGVLRSLLHADEPAPMPDARIANVGGAMIGPLSRLWRGASRVRPD